MDIGPGSHRRHRRRLRLSPEVAPLPRVANHRSINLEALLGPEAGSGGGLALGPGPHAGAVEKLGIPVFYSEPTDFASLATRDAQPGAPARRRTTSERQGRRLSGQTQCPDGALWQVPKSVSVFYQLWYPPLTSVNDSTWPSRRPSPMRRPQHHGQAAPYPQVGLERVIKADPDLIWPAARTLSAGALAAVGPCWTPSSSGGSPSSTPMRLPASPPRPPARWSRYARRSG